MGVTPLHYRADMTCRVCTVSASSPHNWTLACEHQKWGIPATTGATNARVDRARAGDRLLFWLAKSGYVGYATVTENARTPTGRDDVPWAGGLYGWSVIVPMRLDFVCPKAVWLPFRDFKQTRTGISQYALRRGFLAIPDEAADAALQAIHEVHPVPEQPSERR